MKITRETLINGSVMALQRQHADKHPDMRWRTEAEMAHSFETMLGQLPAEEDLWVFGYGSLIWNPAFDYDEKRCALLRGWHRRFCLKLYAGRGTVETPGLMLALDRGGACRGVAFRIPRAKVRQELHLLWQREMFGGSYNARWVKLAPAGGQSGEAFRAITFVINHAHPRYMPELSVEQTAALIATGCGELGSCREYLENTVAHLLELGVKDTNLTRIVAALPKP